MKKKIVIYGIGIFFSKVLVFCMIPIYTRFLETTDYGYYDVLISNMQMLVSISFIEIWSGIIRFMFEADTSPYKTIKTCIELLPILMIFYAIGVILLSFIMEIRYPILTVIYGISYMMFNCFNNICRGLGKNVDYIVSGVIRTIVSCGMNIYGIVVLHKGVSFLILSEIVGFLFAVLYVEIKTHSILNGMKEITDKQKKEEMLLYCFPLMINSFSFLFLGTYNKNIVLRELGEMASGYYAFALKYSAILSIIISVYSLAWQEVAFQKASQETRAESYSFYINKFFKVIGLGVPVFIMASYFTIPILGGKEYINAGIFIPLAIGATLISEISGLFSIVIAVNKKTMQTLISTIIGAASNVIIANLIISRIGLQGSNIALMIGFAVAAICRYAFCIKDIKLDISIKCLGVIVIEIIGTLIAYARSSIYIQCAVLVFVGGVWLITNRQEIYKIIQTIKFKKLYYTRRR